MSSLALNQGTPPAEVRHESGRQEANTPSKALGRLTESFGSRANRAFEQGQQLPPPEKQSKRYSRGPDVADTPYAGRQTINPSDSSKLRGGNIPPRTLGRGVSADLKGRSSARAGAREDGDELAFALKQMSGWEYGASPVENDRNLRGPKLGDRHSEEVKLRSQIATLRERAISNDGLTPRLQEVRGEIIAQLRLLEAIRLAQPNRIDDRRRFKDARKEALLSDEIDDSVQLLDPDSGFSEDDLLELDERLRAQQEEQQILEDELRDENYAGMVRGIEEDLNAEDLAWGQEATMAQKQAEDEEHGCYLNADEELEYADEIAAAEEYVAGVKSAREMESEETHEAYLKSQGQEAQSQDQAEAQARIELYDESQDQRYVEDVVRMNNAAYGAKLALEPEPKPELKPESGLEPELDNKGNGNGNGNGHVEHPLFAARVTNTEITGLTRRKQQPSRRDSDIGAEA